MVVGSQIPAEKTSYYLKYTWEALSKGLIQNILGWRYSIFAVFGSLAAPLPFQGH